jgi:hypothetical protein
MVQRRFSLFAAATGGLVPPVTLNYAGNDALLAAIATGPGSGGTPAAGISSLINNTNGIRPALKGEINTTLGGLNAAGVLGVTSGMSGNAGVFHVTNPASNGVALRAYNNGNGDGIVVETNNGTGIWVTAPGPGTAVLAASTGGNAIRAFNTSPGNNNDVVNVLQTNDANAVDAKVQNANATEAAAAIVESDRLVVVDRTMSRDGNEYGASSESASVQPAATWYFAEGATGGPFDLFYLLQNPNETPVDVEIKYLRALGELPLTKSYHLEPRSRRTIWVDEERFPDDSGTPLLNATDAAAVIQVTSGGPILAEGATGSFFEMFILLANPGAEDANVSASYLLPNGTVFNKTYTVPGNGRFTVWVDEEEIPASSGIRPLSDVAVSTTLKSDQPIVVERAMWWPQNAGGWREGSSTAASNESALRWVTAGGEIGGTRNEQTYVLVANVDNVPAAVP